MQLIPVVKKMESKYW